MAADWEEVKRLAADFQRAQLSSTVQSLSERNCVEIVKKLIELKLIDVIFTCDGKEYLTPKRLLKEIKDELLIHSGRVSLVELSQILNVDLAHVEAKASEYSKSDPTVRLVLGQLVSSGYLDWLAEEVDEKLQENGQITVGELTKVYDLPGDFLEEVLHERIGTIIRAHPDSSDPRTFYTSSYVSNNKARILGILSAVTRPALVSDLLRNFRIPEKQFYGVAEELIKARRIHGTIFASRSDKSLYIPDIYSNCQNKWVESFYKQNGYLEYDAVSRLGISDPKSFIKKKFKDEQLTFLMSCCVGKTVLSQVESAIEDALNLGVPIDVMPIIPSVCSSDDCQQIIKAVIKAAPKHGRVINVFCDSIIVSEDVLQNCIKLFLPMMEKKAQEDIEKKPHVFLPQKPVTKSGKKEEPKKEEPVSKGGKQERKKKGVGKGGAGTQGRETKIRSVKKKHFDYKNEEAGSDDEAGGSTSQKEGRKMDLQFLGIDEIKVHLLQNLNFLQEFSEDLASELAEQLERPLNKNYEEVAQSAYEAMVSSSGSARRKQHADFQEQLNSLLAHITLFSKSIKLFSDDVSVQLSKHLLKTLCTDVVNMMVESLAHQHLAQPDTGAELTTESRSKLIDQFPVPIDHLKKLHNSLRTQSMEEFEANIDETISTCLPENWMAKRSDKKKERQMLANHRQSLLAQLTETTDPALCLHLAVLLIFQMQTRNILHASGKFVPHIISYLQRHVPLEVYQELSVYQEYVIKSLKSKDDEQEKTTVFLTEMMPKLKETATSFKKASLSESDPTSVKS